MRFHKEIAVARRGAFSGAPRRLRRVVAYAALLGLAGVDVGDAHDSIERVIWAGGLLPIDRSSQQRAWRVTLDAAMRAYADAIDAAHRDVDCIEKARAVAPVVFDGLPSDASIAAFAAALLKAVSFLRPRDAASIARDETEMLGRAPIERRAPAPGANPFAELMISPSASDLYRYSKAVRMLEAARG